MMKKSLLLLSLATLFTGCSSPPEPMAFPHESKERNANDFIFQNRTPSVPLNRLDYREWEFSIINHGQIINQPQTAKFWYLAHHATDIDIYGAQNNIELIRLELISKGVKGKITLSQCYSMCGQVVSMKFEKHKPIPLPKQEQDDESSY